MSEPAATADHRTAPAARAHRAATLSCMALALLLLAGCATHAPIRDRVVVVTGASSGFGRGVALRAADEGAAVVLAARRTALIDALAADIRSRGGRALAVTTDVAREEDVAHLAQATLAAFGRIDAWVNNAGVGAYGAFDEVPLADHRRVIEVNLLGVINGSHVALRQFRAQGQGTLVNVASVAGALPFPYYASYSASKHGVLGLGLSLHQELRTQGARRIHVSTVLPFAADTPWFHHAAHYAGREPRMVLLDDPWRVVDAIVGAIARPRKQISVGFKAKLAVFAGHVAPGPTQAVAGSVMRRILRDSPPAPDANGSLYAPMPSGTGVDGLRDDRSATQHPAAGGAGAEPDA